MGTDAVHRPPHLAQRFLLEGKEQSRREERIPSKVTQDRDQSLKHRPGESRWGGRQRGSLVEKYPKSEIFIP